MENKTYIEYEKGLIPDCRRAEPVKPHPDNYNGLMDWSHANMRYKLDLDKYNTELAACQAQRIDCAEGVLKAGKSEYVEGIDFRIEKQILNDKNEWETLTVFKCAYDDFVDEARRLLAVPVEGKENKKLSEDEIEALAKEIGKKHLGEFWYIIGKYQKEVLSAMKEMYKANK